MQNLFGLLEQSANRYGDKVFCQIREKDNWQRLSFRQLRDSAEALARALKSQGFGTGDKIAVISENRPEWGIVFFAVLRIDAIVIPLDKLLKKDEIQSILEKGEPKLLICSAHFLDVLSQIPLKIPILCLDENPSKFPTLAHGVERGLQSPELGQPLSTSESTAIMIFTSGTTGNPKGVMLTHGNFLSNVESFFKLFPASFFKSNFLSILPLNHAFELTGGFLTPLYGGGTITYQDSLKPTHVLQTMRDTATRIMLTVPAFLEMLYRNLLHQVGQSEAKQKKFNFALKLASLCPAQGFRRWLFREIHAVFGGDLQYFVSGGAPLSGEVQEAFEKLGFTVIQGYGLTETSPVVTVNPFHRTKRNSVGRPVPGIEVRIEGEEGEILVKGPNVMKGYYKDPEATEAVFKEGYFATGDIGYVDRDGYIYISGRLKNLIVTSAGKKVFPEEIEEKLKAVPYVKEGCILGRKTGLEEEVIAVVIPDQDKLKQNETPRGEVRGILWEGIKKMNGTMADYKRIKDLIVWEGEFPKTTTLKVKRRELEQLIQGQVRSKVVASSAEPVT